MQLLQSRCLEQNRSARLDASCCGMKHPHHQPDAPNTILPCCVSSYWLLQDALTIAGLTIVGLTHVLLTIHWQTHSLSQAQVLAGPAVLPSGPLMTCHVHG